MDAEYARMLDELKRAGHRVGNDNVAPPMSRRDAMLADAVALAIVEWTRPLERRIAALEDRLRPSPPRVSPTSDALSFWQ